MSLRLRIMKNIPSRLIPETNRRTSRWPLYWRAHWMTLRSGLLYPAYFAKFLVADPSSSQQLQTRENSQERNVRPGYHRQKISLEEASELKDMFVHVDWALKVHKKHCHYRSARNFSSRSREIKRDSDKWRLFNSNTRAHRQSKLLIEGSECTSSALLAPWSATEDGKDAKAACAAKDSAVVGREGEAVGRLAFKARFEMRIRETYGDLVGQQEGVEKPEAGNTVQISSAGAKTSRGLVKGRAPSRRIVVEAQILR